MTNFKTCFTSEIYQVLLCCFTVKAYFKKERTNAERRKQPAISGLTLLFEYSPSRAHEIEHFEIFSHPWENQLAQWFFIKIWFAIVLSHFLMLGVFYAYSGEYKHNDCFF